MTDRSQLQATPNLDAEKVAYKNWSSATPRVQGSIRLTLNGPDFVDALLHDVQATRELI